jgi:hypothetical protein
MPDDKPKVLGDIFEQHRSQKQGEQAEAHAKDVEQARRSQECKNRLREIVVPVLLRMADEIKKQGHKAEVNLTMLDRFTHPTVSLSFKSSDPTPRHTFPESALRFSCGGAKDEIAAGSEIWGTGGQKSGENIECPLASLTEEWITERVRRFVRAVLAGT